MSSAATSSDVQSVLNRLGGVYRDTTRVSRDASNLVTNTNGRALRPAISELLENDGTHHPRVLSLAGTIAMTYRGSRYNVPVDVYLPPSYPARPPICYVRPIPSMVLKENHRHVGRDGLVYMPYLHEWRQYTSNLVEMVVHMSSIFGADPPVYARPKNYRPPPAAATATGRPVSSSATSPGGGGRPPSYGQAAAAASSSSGQQQEWQVIEESKREAERLAKVREEERLKEQQILEDSRRTAEAAEKELISLRSTVTSRIQARLHEYFNNARSDIQRELRNQAQLEQNKHKITSQGKQLREQKVMLSSQLRHVEEQTEAVTAVIDAAEAKLAEKEEAALNGNGEAKKKEEDDDERIDAMAIPADVHSRQMLDLVAKNASISDCLYYLDKALVRGKIPLDVHLKTVRKLAKKQFLARAHMMKISGVQQSYFRS